MHILLIEDDPNDVFLITEMLTSYPQHKVEIFEADSTTEAIKALSTKHFDVILLDLSLIDSNGIETFKTINLHSHSIPIVILSGNSDEKLALAAVKAGAQDYVHKDEVTAKILFRIISHAIERKQIEEELKQVSLRLHLALTAAKVGTWSIEIETQKAYWDDYLSRLYGVEPGSFSGNIEDAMQRIHPDDRDRARQEILRSVKENVPYDTEHRIIWPDGTTRILAKRGEVQRDAAGKATHVTGVCWDVTERKKAEQWFQKHQFELANVSRINSMGEVATTLAHEINQPLAAVSAFLQGSIHRLENDNFDKAELLNILVLASQQIDRAGKIIERIENFAHRGSLIFESSDINQVIKNSCDLMYYGNSLHKPTIKFELNSSLPLIKLDKVQIEQVITNLLTNSIEAFEIGETSNPMITINTNITADNQLEINITDNGPGIPAEVMTEIFKPYFTTKANSVGIGLAICRTIIQAHGGTLTAKYPAQGAYFKILLPIK